MSVHDHDLDDFDGEVPDEDLLDSQQPRGAGAEQDERTDDDPLDDGDSAGAPVLLVRASLFAAAVLILVAVMIAA